MFLMFVGESTRRVLCGLTSPLSSVCTSLFPSPLPLFHPLTYCACILYAQLQLFVLTMTMMGVNSSHPRAIAISYVYFLFSGLSCRQYTCSSFSLTYSKSAHHSSSSFSQNRHIHHVHQRYTTKSLSSSKLLDDTNCNQIDASKKWSFALSNNAEEPKDSDDTIRRILVCGDGDLSYSAEIASELDALGIELYATVLEDEATHNKGTLAT